MTSPKGEGIDFRRHRIGLYKQVLITLILLRQNMSQMVIADMYQVSQTQDQPDQGAGSLRSWRRCWLFTSGGLTEAIEEGQLLLIEGHPHFPTGNRPASGQGEANHSGKRKGAVQRHPGRRH